MEYETIKLDVAFPSYQETRLKEFLSRGWRIADKTVVGDRYIYYVLAKLLDEKSPDS